MLINSKKFIQKNVIGKSFNVYFGVFNMDNLFLTK